MKQCRFPQDSLLRQVEGPSTRTQKPVHTVTVILTGPCGTCCLCCLPDTVDIDLYSGILLAQLAPDIGKPFHVLTDISIFMKMEKPSSLSPFTLMWGSKSQVFLGSASLTGMFKFADYKFNIRVKKSKLVNKGNKNHTDTVVPSLKASLWVCLADSHTQCSVWSLTHIGTQEIVWSV